MKRICAIEESADKVSLKVIKSTFKVLQCDKQFPHKTTTNFSFPAFKLQTGKFRQQFQDEFEVLFLFVFVKL